MTNDQRIAAVLRLRREGVANRDIAQRLGLTKNQVAGICNRAMARGEIPHVPRTLGVPGGVPGTAPRVWAREDEQRLLDLARASATNAEIAAAIGASVGAIKSRLAALRAVGHVVPIRRFVPETPAAAPSRAAGGGAPTRSSRPDARLALAPQPREHAGGAVPPVPPRQPLLRPRGPFPACRTCQWPEGEPRAPGFRFCEAATVSGAVYCATHLARAYVHHPLRAVAA